MGKRFVGILLLMGVLWGVVIWIHCTDRMDGIRYNRNDVVQDKCPKPQNTLVSPRLMQRLDCVMKRGS